LRQGSIALIHSAPTGRYGTLSFVMAGLDRAIHVFAVACDSPSSSCPGKSAKRVFALDVRP
jgi:hypothetical protein